MANPRQRRKVRSSSHKPIKLSRQANKLLKKQPPIKGPKILQEAWDKHKTVRQNYAALGLAHSLAPTDSGGTDITRVDTLHSTESQSAGSNRVEEAGSGTGEAAETAWKGRKDETSGDGEASTKAIPRGFGKIVRDGKGAVVDVILDAEDASVATQLAENALDDRQPGSLPGADWLLAARSPAGVGVVQALEARARAGARTVARTASRAEVGYLQRLVERHGADYAAMARDRANVQQHTAGQLRRAVARAGLLSG